MRKELQSVIATEMAKLEPMLKNTSVALLSQLSQNKTILEAYSEAASGAAAFTMNRVCKDTIAQQLLPSMDRSFNVLFSQVHDTFSKGISECEQIFSKEITERILITRFYNANNVAFPVVRNIEKNVEHHRRLQDKESSVQLSASMEKMSAVLDQARQSILNETKMEFRKISQE